MCPHNILILAFAHGVIQQRTNKAFHNFALAVSCDHLLITAKRARRKYCAKKSQKYHGPGNEFDEQ
jgi:hypothetical protein